MKDTIRLILFTECNLSCHYCCNEQEQFSSQFVKKSFSEIDFSKYKNVCITGGEPFLRKRLLYHVMVSIPSELNLFLYTNGTLISFEDVLRLLLFENIKAINIGIHSVNQIDEVHPALDYLFNIRYMIQDTKLDQYMSAHPKRFTEQNTKAWKLNDCNMPNEDWVLLKEGSVQ